MSHYFLNDKNLKNEETYFDVQIQGTSFRFYVNNGVFSKNGLDYGTRVLLEHITLDDSNLKIIDMGCGYGPVGTFIGKKYPNTEIFMYDVNERAVDLSKKNLVVNRVPNASVVLSFLFEKSISDADVVITNPPIRTGKQTVFRLYEEAYTHLKENGALYVVIQKKQGAPSTLEKLKSLFKTAEVIGKDGGYWIIYAVK